MFILTPVLFPDGFLGLSVLPCRLTGDVRDKARSTDQDWRVRGVLVLLLIWGGRIPQCCGARASWGFLCADLELTPPMGRSGVASLYLPQLLLQWHMQNRSYFLLQNDALLRDVASNKCCPV